MSKWKDLAPEIVRQRIVIEGTLHNPFKAEDMDRYCREMTRVLKMTEATAPFCNYDPDSGGARTFTGKKAVCTFMLGTTESHAFFLLMFTPVEPLIQKRQ